MKKKPVLKTLWRKLYSEENFCFGAGPWLECNYKIPGGFKYFRIEFKRVLVNPGSLSKGDKNIMAKAKKVLKKKPSKKK